MTRAARALAAGLLLPLAAAGVRAQEPQPVRGSDAIAVLAFANLSPDPEDAWLGDGIAETLTAELTARGLTVVGSAGPPVAISGGTVGGEGAGGDFGRLHRRLDARWAVTGSYQQVGQRLRINARIVDLPSAVVVHAVRTDGDRHEIFAMQDRIAGELAAGLRAVRNPAPKLPSARSTSGLRTEDAPAPRLGNPPPGTDARADGAPAGAPARLGGPTTGDRPQGRPVESAAGLSSTPLTPRGPADAATAAGGTAGLDPFAAPRRRRPTDAAPFSAAGETARVEPGPAGGGIPGSAAEGGAGVPTPAGGVAGLGVASGAGILTGRPSVRPERTAAAPRIDGTLDDPVWERATRISNFVQQRPLDGAPATEDSEVYIAYDNDNLYFGIRAHYSDPALIRANRADRDQTFIDDTVAVYFDPFLDQQRAYVFSVNGYGVQADSLLESSAQRMSGGGGGGGRPGGGGGRTPGSGRGGMSAALAASLGAPPTGDLSWDALFDSAARLVADGWTAEMAIPFKSLRYPERRPGEPHRWGFQIVRTIFGKDEADVWSPVSRGVAGFLTQMGLLDGLTNLSTSRNLEILPTRSPRSGSGRSTPRRGRSRRLRSPRAR